MKKNLRGWLGFSKREMNAVVVCIPLILFFIFLPSLYSIWFRSDYDNTTDLQLLDSLVKQIRSVDDPIMRPIEPFYFDPNELSLDSFMLLGVPPFLAQRIVNYRNAGGSFEEVNGLKNIYDFPDSLFQSLRPYILIRPSTNRVPQLVKEQLETIEKGVSDLVDSTITTPEKKLLIPLNSADTIQFKKLRGIGSVYANRIVKYRKILGGFSDIEQLKEVYGVSDSLFISFKDQLIIRDSVLAKIKINLSTFKEINAHPYISYEQTKEIFNAKSKIGKFRTKSDLINLKSFDSLQVMRLLPYIDFK